MQPEHSAPQAAAQETLDELAARIRDAHKTVLAAVANALAAALDAGDAVLELQRELRDRRIGWQAWFRERGYLPLGTAKLYAQLAAHRDKIEAARAKNPELSLRAARRLISKSATETLQDKPAAIGPASETSSRSHEKPEEVDPDLALMAALDNVTLEQCLQAMPQSWLDALEQQVTEHLSVEQLLKLLETKLEHTPKMRAALNDIRKALRRPQLELVANPTADKSTQVIATISGATLHDDVFCNYRQMSLADLENLILSIQRAAGRGVHVTPAEWSKLDRVRTRAAELKRNLAASAQGQERTMTATA